MKVIGKSKDGFILQATETEVANLIGYYSERSDGFKVKPGDEINVHDMFQTLYQMDSHAKEIELIQRKLREIADNLEPVVPILREVKEAN